MQLVDTATAPHGIDRYIELVAPTWSSREIRARVVEVSRRAPNTVTLGLAANRNWTGFQAGQHTLVTVEIDGVRQTRCYSIASSAHRGDTVIELTVKAHATGTVSRYLVDHGRIGLVVGLSPAQGTYVLPRSRPQKLVLISGGSGITPNLSMLRTLIDERHDAPVTFVHYDKAPESNPYRDQLAAAPANVGVVLVPTSHPGGGHFTPDHLAGAGIDGETEVFVCGPASLRDAVRAHLTAHGWGGRYHEEAFTPTADPGAGGPTDATIAFTASGRTVADDGRSLLHQAQATGLSPNHGCGMGICHTCTVPLTAGAVRNLNNGDVTCARADSRPVPIQICIHAPAGDVAVDL
jgi:stearoyl-CoA 9-desaturase NADPH oxidoreductase